MNSKNKVVIVLSFLLLITMYANIAAQSSNDPDLSFRDFASQDQLLEYVREVQHNYGSVLLKNLGRSYNLGDVNNDGTISIVDALIIARHDVGMYIIPWNPCTGDVDGNGVVDIVDALWIARYIVGLIEELPSSGGDQQLPAEPILEELDYSTTNIQEAVVDEADIIKSDGQFIYNLLPNQLIISRAYPPDEAKIINILPLPAGQGVAAKELYLDGSTLVVITTTRMTRTLPNPYYGQPTIPCYTPPESFTYTNNLTRASIYDITDRYNLILQREVELDGNYLTSRKIGSILYLLTKKNFIRYRDLEDPSIEYPLYRDTAIGKDYISTDYTQMQYLPFPVKPAYLNIGSLNLAAPGKKMEVLALTAPANHVYCSKNNIYIAFYHQNNTDLFRNLPWFPPLTMPIRDTYLYQLQLNGLMVTPGGVGSVPGSVLNRFSMSEYAGYFRVATTVGTVTQTDSATTTNVYILDENMQQVGALEGLAPGEKIYSARFTGSRGYLVTFKKVDPLFVIDLSEPTLPSVLGKLKIPGYSDYLHPYDANHIIGIGKDTVAADTGNFAWFQGIKLALFDVTDVTNPVQLHQEVIGHRGTDSEALRDPRALLFSLRKNLLVLPISLAEFDTEPASDSAGAPLVYRGAYVYDLNLENGFNLRGRVSHNKNQVVGKLARAIKRSLYIEDILYTFSNTRLQLNDLETVERIKILEF